MARTKTVVCAACFLLFAPKKDGPSVCPHCEHSGTDYLEDVRSPDVADKIVQELEKRTFDDPGLHIQEDCLYVSVLRAIAEGKAEGAALLAKTALKAADIDFERWYE